MVMRVQLVEGEHRVVLPLQALEEMHLKAGDSVQVSPVAKHSPVEDRTMTMEEGMEAYRSFERDNREVFLELAK